jgi:hypothetical protein
MVTSQLRLLQFRSGWLVTLSRFEMFRSTSGFLT